MSWKRNDNEGLDYVGDPHYKQEEVKRLIRELRQRNVGLPNRLLTNALFLPEFGIV